MRVAKKHDVRLNEILDASEALFMLKGYENTTVNDILDKVGIGKGTFYHYFKSKEEAMDAMVDRMIRQMDHFAKEIAGDPKLTAHQKMRRIISGVNINHNPQQEVVEELHRSDNALLHQRSISGIIETMTPIMTDVIMQGIEEGVYHTAYPLETSEFILAGSQLIFDAGYFLRTPEEQQSRMTALIGNIELLLGASEGSFAFLMGNLPQEKQAGR
jgi:AcrR family transcriptional regulator